VNARIKSPVLLCAGLTLGLIALASGAVVSPRPLAAQEATPALAQRAQAILKKNCSSAGCHGNTSPQKGLNVLKPESLSVVINRSQPEKSKLLEVLQDGYMPLGAQKLPEAEIETIRAWLTGSKGQASPAGKPPVPAAKPRAFIPEKAVLDAIVADLIAAPERDRVYLRYYSLANLSNNPEVDEKELALYRSALSKLVNHLSWDREIAVPQAVGPGKTVLRIDLRSFSWNEEIWQRIISAYPYGLIPRNLRGQVDQIHALSHATFPYIRVDWFISNASIPPLYHDILQLPDNVPDLERKLGVNSDQNVRQERAVRSGLRNSGVSVSNRAMERHPSLYGAYWKSFDYANNRGQKNLFADPVDLHPDGGEFVFHLPNGLNGYFISDAAGKRLDVAPIAIVRDKTNFIDPEVRTGRSCIGCHFQGYKGFVDEVEPIIRTQLKAHFDLEKAEALYKGQKVNEALLKRDTDQFIQALKAAGSPVPQSDREESVNQIAVLYGGDLSVAQAAADAYFSDVKEFQAQVARSSDLEKLGFGQLQGANGGIKRDLWEENFGGMAEALRLGAYLKPGRLHIVRKEDHQRDARTTVSVGVLTGPEPQAAQLRQSLIFWLNQSNDVRVVSGPADYNLKGTLLVKNQREVVAQIGDPVHRLNVSAPGAPQDTAFLAQQLANQANFAISSNWLPVAGSGAAGLVTQAEVLAAPRPTPAVPGLAGDPVQDLINQVGTGGPVRLFLSVDRGPGSTYRGGEDVSVGFRADRDCFVTIYNIDSTGKVVLLFPNQHVPDNRVRANQAISLVDPKDGSSLIQVDPNGSFGIERVLAFATLTPIALPGVTVGRGALGQVDGNFSDFKGKTLKVKDETPQLVTVPGGGGGASSALVQFFTTR
jgi:mono/diheme cytochrome c family protein